MYEKLLLILFRQDDRFVRLHAEGIPQATQAMLQEFWSAPARQPLATAAQLVPGDAKALAKSLETLVRLPHQGTGGEWQRAAEATADLAQNDPLAGAIVALQALGAWVGALGQHLYEQPWTGHHPGWHTFPLFAARRLMQVDAVWASSFLCETAAGFIESAKDAPFDPGLRSVIADYVAVKATAEARLDDCISELAWYLRDGAATAGPETFRAELAALFHVAGDTLHARLLGPGGPVGYLPPLGVVRTLVADGIRKLAHEPLTQFVWLAMKDRGPFSLREHRVLFGRINNRFHGHVLHQIDELFPLSVGRAYAAAAIALMRGDLQEAVRSEFLKAFALGESMIRGGAPDAYLRLLVLVQAIDPTPPSDDDRWQRLAMLAAEVLQWTDDNGIYEPLDHVMDAPFHELPNGTKDELEDTLGRIELYRRANLGYWLSMSPPLRQRHSVPAEMREQEDRLLEELRGARFIRLLPHLPLHYRRYGFNIAEALTGPPTGAAQSPGDPGLLKFDPFDQVLGQRNLAETRDRLRQLYETMRSACPAYAQARLEPPSSSKDFVTALAAHRQS